jgi:hypothetical protein
LGTIRSRQCSGHKKENIESGFLLSRLSDRPKPLWDNGFHVDSLWTVRTVHNNRESTVIERIEWTYSPGDLFEAPTRHAVRGGTVALDSGKAVFVPDSAAPIERPAVEAATAELRTLLDLRRVQVGGRPYTLSVPAVVREHEDGRRDTTVFIDGVEATATVGSIHAVVLDASGRVVADSKAERIAADTAELDYMLDKCSHSPRLGAMLTSYLASYGEPQNAFTRLYEVREALEAHYDGEVPARAALGISLRTWRRFGCLANKTPVLESRHRGRHGPELRPATPEEMDEARRLARVFLRTFAAKL